MGITKKQIKAEIDKSEKNLYDCWELLSALKDHRINAQDFGIRFITFQEKLAVTIFSLQSIRDKIIAEEKTYVFNKARYNLDWFKAKLRQLAGYKEALDFVVNTTKALGDAYAYFFYQNDPELLSQHLTHKKVVNHTAGNGERGELEFVRRIKHIEGRFTLFHGITNLLRYGDFSFIDLKTIRVAEIGELKTKYVNANTLESSITLYRKRKGQPAPKEPIRHKEKEKNRIGRQELGIINFLLGTETDISADSDVFNKSYIPELTDLLKAAKINRFKMVQVSPGLAISCYQFKKASLFNHLFNRQLNNLAEKGAKEVQRVAPNLIRPNTRGNSLIMSQMLYDKGESVSDVPGAVPLFWHPLENDLLKKIYFHQTTVMCIFNPVHLIQDIHQLGFRVTSEYYKEEQHCLVNSPKGELQNFDLFISYITDQLLTEDFVLDMLKEIQKSDLWGKVSQIRIKPQQRMDIFRKGRRSGSK